MNASPTRIAVAGGTGTVGRYVVQLAEEAGHEVVVLARANGVDLLNPETIDLKGVDAVIDVLSHSHASAKAGKEFFVTTTHNLQQAEKRDGVGHHVALSIIGVDLANAGYYAGKYAQEQAVAGGDVPWTILRAAQFHEFAGQIAGRAGVGGRVMIPKMRSQPLPAKEVARKLVRLAEGVPSGRVADLAGPREENMADLTRKLFRAEGRTDKVVEVPIPGGFGKALRNGVVLPGPGAELNDVTFEAWLDEQFPVGSQAPDTEGPGGLPE